MILFVNLTILPQINQDLGMNKMNDHLLMPNSELRTYLHITTVIKITNISIDKHCTVYQQYTHIDNISRYNCID